MNVRPTFGSGARGGYALGEGFGEGHGIFYIAFEGHHEEPVGVE